VHRSCRAGVIAHILFVFFRFPQSVSLLFRYRTMPPKKKTKKAVVIDPLQIQPNDAVVNAGQNCYPSSRPHATVRYANLCNDASLEYIQLEKKKKAGTMTNSDYRKERNAVATRCLSGIRLLKKVDGGLLEVVSDPLFATKGKITTLKGDRIKQERIANARASNEIVQVAPEKSIVISSSLCRFHCEELAEAKTFAESEYARLTRQMSDAKEGDETSRDEYAELRRDIAKVSSVTLTVPILHICSNSHTCFPLRVQIEFRTNSAE